MKTKTSTTNGYSLPYFLFFLVCFSCLFSCKKDSKVDVEVQGEAKVKFINASQSTTSVDFYLNNKKINTQSLAFAQSSNYINVESGAKIATASPNAVTTVQAATITLVPTLSYTSFYVQDRLGKGEILFFEDNLGATEVGKARVRFVNLSPNLTNAVNINLTGNILVVNALAFKESSSYFAIDPSLEVRVSVVGSAAIKVIPGTDFEAGKIYTVWLSGSSNANLTVNKITYN